MNKTDITIDTYNNVIDEYESYYKSKGDECKVHFRKEIDYVVSKLGRGARILDAGTAAGYYPQYLTNLADKEFDVIGIDASEKMLERAAKNAPKATFKLMDLRNIDFPEKSFDAILCMTTLHHLNDEDCKKVLDAFDRIIKPNGFIAITVMEHLAGDKEIFIDEPLNTKYKLYLNHYSKNFFGDYFVEKGYKNPVFFDNPIFNASKLGEEYKNSNQFSIIVQK
ncbi:MAG: class I SAM-dependent methyltransferase [Alphaproteobacteria bacterium]|nr:class I SAM-dependent methyltransferase [Alphaproteobacteria bacterium]